MDVRTIVVIGAGPTGRIIALDAMLAGYHVVLEDISRDALQKALAWIRQSLDGHVTLRKVRTGDRDGQDALLIASSSVEDAIRDADLIIEAVPEEMEMKLELFTIFDKFAKTGAIFASASSLPITDMSDMVVHRERCIGLRFSAPRPAQQQIELVPTPLTSDETVAACREVARRMGREVVVTKDEPHPADAADGASRSSQKNAAEA